MNRHKIVEHGRKVFRGSQYLDEGCAPFGFEKSSGAGYVVTQIVQKGRGDVALYLWQDAGDHGEAFFVQEGAGTHIDHAV